MSKKDNIAFNLEMLDTTTNACKVLKVINRKERLSIAQISDIIGISKSGVNSAMRYIMDSPGLCDVSKVDNGNTRRPELAATYRLIEMKVKLSEFTKKSNKEKGTPKRPRQKKSKIVERIMSGLPMGDISPSSRANGYGIGGICHG